MTNLRLNNRVSKKMLLWGTVLLSVFYMSSCTNTSPKTADHVSPAIDSIGTSTKVLAKSDCKPTSVTITANVSDNDGVAQVTLWYRVGRDRDYSSTTMKNTAEGEYGTTIRALDIPGGEYGVFEFYIIAEDGAGNQSKSPLDTSIQLLACVAN